MNTSTKLKFALNFTRFNIIPIYGWLPESNSSKIQILIFELCWCFIFIPSLSLLFPLLASAYTYRDNSEIMTKSVCLSCAVAQCVIKIIFYRLRRNKLENLFKEMEDFIQYSNDSNKQILMKYIAQSSVLHIGLTIIAYVTAFSFILGPFLSSRSLPTDAVYPFPLDNIYIKIIIYINQSIVAIQTVAAVLLDCVIALLLWFICARFEILALSISNCNNFEDLIKCIQQHQHLLRYTNDLKKTISLFILSTILTSTGGALFSAIQLVSDEPLGVKGQYTIVTVTSTLGLFICSWAADSLIEMGYLVGDKAFQCNWYKMKKKSQTCLLHLIAQSQNPIKVEANPMLPNLSLEFFCQFALTFFKIFTSLRIIVG